MSVCVVCLLGCARPVWADAIVVVKAMSASTIAELFVGHDQIRVELEIGVQDLRGFRNLMPDEVYGKLGYEPCPWEDRLARFFAEDWVLRLDGGEALSGRLAAIDLGRRVKRDPITGEPLPTQPEDAEMVVRVTLAYPLAEPPATLTLRPPLDADANYVAANIGFVVYHLGLAVNDFRYLSGPETLDLDWSDPWYSRFGNRNLRRQFDAPMSVFLYVEHFEVRKEIILRPRDAQQWIDLGLEKKQIIPVSEQAELKTTIADFLMEHGQVHIDGRQIQPVLDRIHFVRRTLRRTSVVDPPEDLDINSATLGVIFVYPIEQLPQEVTLNWDLFGPRIQQVRCSATDEAGGLPSMLTPEDPVLRWQNFLTNPKVPAMIAIKPPPAPWRVTLPVISTLCGALVFGLGVAGVRRRRREQFWPRGPMVVGALAALCGLLAWPYARASLTIPRPGGGSLQPQQAGEVLGGLLHNIYRAFDWRDESAIYDRLALSITGDLLSDVYLQTRRSMELEGQGGARVKVNEVEILQVSPQQTTDTGGFVYGCRWNVSGSVGHWGHIHQRINQYEAVFTVEPVDGAWRIAAIDLRQEKRIDPSAISQGQGA